MNSLPLVKERNNKAIGVLGGTFNPIHLGHLAIAEYAYQQFDMSKVLVMPSGNPGSYKDSSKIASAQDRCEMIARTIKPYTYMELSTLEINRDGYTYTSDTLRQLSKEYDSIYFMIGADSLFSLKQWNEADYVMAHCHLLVANRDNADLERIEDTIHDLESNFQARISLLNMPEYPYSSTLIRSHVAAGLSICGMVADEVCDYIAEHHLYRQ